jgi:ketosteroid isomerase-like protein
MTPVQTIQSVYDAFSRGDIAHIVGLVAPNAPWRQSKMLPWGGDYVGPSGAAEFFEKLNAAAETTGFTPRESVEVGNEVHTFGTYSCNLRSTGKSAVMDFMFRWRVDNGRIASFESYVDSAAVTVALRD